MIMNPYTKKVEALDNHCLMLWFENGEQKIFDLKPLGLTQINQELKFLAQS